MTQPFKFRHVNELTGGLVLLVVLALLAGIFLAGHAQRWFEPVYRLALTFPPEGALGLQKGAEVRILGTLVGAVEKIAVDDTGRMTGEIEIRGNFIRFVRQDSRAIVKKKYAVAGDAFVEITRGTGAELPPGRAELACVKDTELTETIQQVIDQVREATLPAIEQARIAVEEYTRVAVSLHDPQGNLQQLLAQLNLLARGLQQGEGSVGQLLKDPALANELREITARINTSLAEVNRILADVRTTTAKLPPMADTVAGEVNDLPGAVFQAQQTLRETQTLIEALQKHWLLRKYVGQVEPTERIPPVETLPPAGGAP